MRGGDDPQVHRNGIDAADRYDGSLLKRPKQFGLNEQREFADLIQEKGAAIRAANETEGGGYGSGERAFHVAEELRLHQLGRKDRTIDGNERPSGAGTKRVNLAGGHFFADTRLPFDQHGGRTAGNEFYFSLQCGGAGW